MANNFFNDNEEHKKKERRPNFEGEVIDTKIDEVDEGCDFFSKNIAVEKNKNEETKNSYEKQVLRNCEVNELKTDENVLTDNKENNYIQPQNIEKSSGIDLTKDVLFDSKERAVEQEFSKLYEANKMSETEHKINLRGNIMDSAIQEKIHVGNIGNNTNIEGASETLKRNNQSMLRNQEKACSETRNFDSCQKEDFKDFDDRKKVKTNFKNEFIHVSIADNSKNVEFSSESNGISGTRFEQKNFATNSNIKNNENKERNSQMNLETCENYNNEDTSNIKDKMEEQSNSNIGMFESNQYNANKMHNMGEYNLENGSNHGKTNVNHSNLQNISKDDVYFTSNTKNRYNVDKENNSEYNIHSNDKNNSNMILNKQKINFDKSKESINTGNPININEHLRMSQNNSVNNSSYVSETTNIGSVSSQTNLSQVCFNNPNINRGNYSNISKVNETNKASQRIQSNPNIISNQSAVTNLSENVNLSLGSNGKYHDLQQQRQVNYIRPDENQQYKSYLNPNLNNYHTESLEYQNRAINCRKPQQIVGGPANSIYGGQYNTGMKPITFNQQQYEIQMQNRYRNANGNTYNINKNLKPDVPFHAPKNITSPNSVQFNHENYYNANNANSSIQTQKAQSGSIPINVKSTTNSDNFKNQFGMSEYEDNEARGSYELRNQSLKQPKTINMNSGVNLGEKTINDFQFHLQTNCNEPNQKLHPNYRSSYEDFNKSNMADKNSKFNHNPNITFQGNIKKTNSQITNDSQKMSGNNFSGEQTNKEDQNSGATQPKTSIITTSNSTQNHPRASEYENRMNNHNEANNVIYNSEVEIGNHGGVTNTGASGRYEHGNFNGIDVSKSHVENTHKQNTSDSSIRVFNDTNNSAKAMAIPASNGQSVVKNGSANMSSISTPGMKAFNAQSQEIKKPRSQHEQNMHSSNSMYMHNPSSDFNSNRGLSSYHSGNYNDPRRNIPNQNNIPGHTNTAQNFNITSGYPSYLTNLHENQLQNPNIPRKNPNIANIRHSSEFNTGYMCNNMVDRNLDGYPHNVDVSVQHKKPIGNISNRGDYPQPTNMQERLHPNNNFYPSNQYRVDAYGKMCNQNIGHVRKPLNMAGHPNYENSYTNSHLLNGMIYPPGNYNRYVPNDSQMHYYNQPRMVPYSNTLQFQGHNPNQSFSAESQYTNIDVSKSTKGDSSMLYNESAETKNSSDTSNSSTMSDTESSSDDVPKRRGRPRKTKNIVQMPYNPMIKSPLGSHYQPPPHINARRNYNPSSYDAIFNTGNLHPEAFHNGPAPSGFSGYMTPYSNLPYHNRANPMSMYNPNINGVMMSANKMPVVGRPKKEKPAKKDIPLPKKRKSAVTYIPREIDEKLDESEEAPPEEKDPIEKLIKREGDTFLVKFRNKSYIHCDYVPISEITATRAGAIKVKRFKVNQEIKPDQIRVEKILHEDYEDVEIPLDDDISEEESAQDSTPAENRCIESNNPSNGKEADKGDIKAVDPMIMPDSNADVNSDPQTQPVIDTENKNSCNLNSVNKLEASDKIETKPFNDLGGKKGDSATELDTKDVKIKDVDAGAMQVVRKRIFLIKWKALYYEYSTFEYEDKVMHLEGFEDELKKYRARIQRPMIAPIDYRPLKEHFIENFTFKNNNKLRPYQLEGLNWLLNRWLFRQSCIMADEMGLGKTVQSVTFINTLHTRYSAGPCLVVAPLSTIPHWVREFENWSDLRVTVYHGGIAARDIINTYEINGVPRRTCPELENEVGASSNLSHNSNINLNERSRPFIPGSKRSPYYFDVIITTYEMIMSGLKHLENIEFYVGIFDEAHRLKNNTSKAAVALKSVYFNHKVLLSGTPLQNNLTELWSLLNFIDPEKFDNPQYFLEEYKMEKSEDVERLQLLLKPLMLRRLKDDVENIPVKEETIIEVELTMIQKKLYRAILEKNLEFLAKGNTHPNLLNAMMELRKCCIHPFLIKNAEEKIIAEYINKRKAIFESGDGNMHIHHARNLILGKNFYSKDTNANTDENNAITADVIDDMEINLSKDVDHSIFQGVTNEEYYKVMIQSSGKLVLIDKLLAKLHGKHKVLIFSQMTKCLDLLSEYLSFRQYKYERIDGGVKTEHRQAAIDRFSEPNSDSFVFLLCTRAGGVGINLTAADTVIIFDSDWNPQNDLQAQARCHRIGQRNEVKIYRLITRNTYEREMFDKASMKLGLDKAILQKTSYDKKQRKKNEIEELLKKGAYGVLMEADDVNKKFCEEDIDSILERRTQIVKHSDKGNVFSKATFQVAEDFDDPDFWSNLLSKKKSEHDENIIRKNIRKLAKIHINWSEVDEKIKDLEKKLTAYSEITENEIKEFTPENTSMSLEPKKSCDLNSNVESQGTTNEDLEKPINVTLKNENLSHNETDKSESIDVENKTDIENEKSETVIFENEIVDSKINEKVDNDIKKTVDTGSADIKNTQGANSLNSNKIDEDSLKNIASCDGIEPTESQNSKLETDSSSIISVVSANENAHLFIFLNVLKKGINSLSTIKNIKNVHKYLCQCTKFAIDHIESKQQDDFKLKIETLLKEDYNKKYFNTYSDIYKKYAEAFLLRIQFVFILNFLVRQNQSIHTGIVNIERQRGFSIEDDKRIVNWTLQNGYDNYFSGANDVFKGKHNDDLNFRLRKIVLGLLKKNEKESKDDIIKNILQTFGGVNEHNEENIRMFIAQYYGIQLSDTFKDEKFVLSNNETPANSSNKTEEINNISMDNNKNANSSGEKEITIKRDGPILKFTAVKTQKNSEKNAAEISENNTEAQTQNFANENDLNILDREKVGEESNVTKKDDSAVISVDEISVSSKTLEKECISEFVEEDKSQNNLETTINPEEKIKSDPTTQNIIGEPLTETKSSDNLVITKERRNKRRKKNKDTLNDVAENDKNDSIDQNKKLNGSTLENPTIENILKMCREKVEDLKKGKKKRGTNESQILRKILLFERLKSVNDIPPLKKLNRKWSIEKDKELKDDVLKNGISLEVAEKYGLSIDQVEKRIDEIIDNNDLD
ncbi:hypothetical protein EDEG_00050 [Edhazardia aedis USNM 41457]|uniref:Helicase ATP-binding domain-containing protein n=1 Tax=Edhazardia aedis (strain USNM 41457) TaxID=1003232 RepID=J9DCB7_EDHAE|nr:hypothetical protein EDEG_00050 [Edhazardia aedis USNM 41457]|eukprot:EJW05386.1 hypothetical protein EDEG_00050 [Edhazardia aedis USNM 41457]